MIIVKNVQPVLTFFTEHLNSFCNTVFFKYLVHWHEWAGSTGAIPRPHRKPE